MKKENVIVEYDEIQDGKDDVYFNINNIRFITFHREGFHEIGFSYEQMKELGLHLATIIKSAIEVIR